MLSVKGGTQTWSNSSQKSSFGTDGAQNLGTGDRDKALGGEENIGDLLNKVSDPNFVDPSKKERRVGNPELGKDAFMSLLLTQMKNQDPTTPLKSHEMAAQLAQFTQLEKLNNINDGIAGMRKDAQPNQNFQALSFIGKTIATDNAKISRTDKESHHNISFDLPADASKLTLQIKDAEGKVVKTQELHNLKTGRNVANWSGEDEKGASVPPGDYTASFEATGSNGHKLHVETKLQGTISGVNFTPAGPQLLVGKQVVSMAEVRTLTDPSLMPDAQPKSLAVPNNVPGAGAAATGGLPPGITPDMLPKGMSMTPPNGAKPAAKPGGRMFPIGGMKNPAEAAPVAADAASEEAPVPAQSPKKAEVKPEYKANAAKAAKLNKSNLNDASMTQGLINKLNSQGAKAGMDS